MCIATPDILGPNMNGGIGTAYHHLARALVQWGHQVVIAYVARNAANLRLMEKTRLLYSGYGVGFEPIIPRPAAKGVLAPVAAPTWALYEWLRARERPFDIVHVPDWRGLGYGALLAKSLGIAFGSTHFVVKGSSPTLWATEGNRQFLSTEQELGWVFMERRSIELADTVICDNAHLLEWMHEAGYAVPPRSFVCGTYSPHRNIFRRPQPGARVRTTQRYKRWCTSAAWRHARGSYSSWMRWTGSYAGAGRRHASPSSATSRPASTAPDSFGAPHGTGRSKYAPSPISGPRRRYPISRDQGGLR